MLVRVMIVHVIDNRSAGARLVCGCSFCHGLRHEAGGETLDTGHRTHRQTDGSWMLVLVCNVMQVRSTTNGNEYNR